MKIEDKLQVLINKLPDYSWLEDIPYMFISQEEENRLMTAAVLKELIQILIEYQDLGPSSIVLKKDKVSDQDVEEFKSGNPNFFDFSKALKQDKVSYVHVCADHVCVACKNRFKGICYYCGESI